MSHQGRSRAKPVCNADTLSRCVRKLLPPGATRRLAFATTCTWSTTTLIATALFWAWSDEETLTERFQMARKITMKCFRVQQELSAAYQPFMRMLVRWSDALQDILLQRLREAMQSMTEFRESGFAIVAVDGSRFEVPRTQSNEQAFSPRDDNGKRKRRVRRKRRAGDIKKSSSPQVWLTVVWHLGCGLPWSWKQGESGSSEREHLQNMLDHLPKNTLLTADAGFTGYASWQAILDHGHDFLIRVGSNVKLLQKLGYARETSNRIYLWTDRAAVRHQPPLVLRLLIVPGAKHPVYLVTSVLNSRRLSDAELATIYARRWGIEVYYRHLKQTFDLRKLRSRTPIHVELELQWALIGLWSVCWLAHSTSGVPVHELSIVQVLRALRRTMREYKSDADAGDDLWTRWTNACIDTYERRNKSSRDYPRKKSKRQLIGIPDIQIATSAQRRHAAHLKQNKAA